MPMRHWFGAALALGLLATFPAVTAVAEPAAAIPIYTQPGAVNLAVDPAGRLAIVELGSGAMDGRIVRLEDLDGSGAIDNEAELQVVANGLPSVPGYDAELQQSFVSGLSGAAWSPAGDLYAITSTFWDDFTREAYGALWSSAAPNDSTNPLRTLNPVASLAHWELTMNPDGGDINPNPYDLAVDAAGNAYVNDAGANVTLKVTPDGTVSTFALYPPVVIPPDLGLPFPFAEPVPTGIALGPDGALYSGQLTGFPFLPGAASVYRLSDDNGDGDALDAGELTVVAGGLTTVTDIAVGPDGTLYASEFRGFLTAGDGPPQADGSVVRWTGAGWEPLASGLPMPTSLAVTADGSVHVLTLDGTIWRIAPAG